MVYVSRHVELKVKDTRTPRIRQRLHVPTNIQHNTACISVPGARVEMVNHGIVSRLASTYKVGHKRSYLRYLFRKRGTQLKLMPGRRERWGEETWLETGEEGYRCFARPA